MSTLNLRSNATLTRYVQTSQKLATLAMKIAELSKSEKQQRADVLQELAGQTRQVQVRERVYTLTPSKTESIGQIDGEHTVKWCQEHAFSSHLSERSKLWMAPATFKKLAVHGLVPESLIKRETTEIVVVT